ncbi:MAG: hypothetical protein C4324_08140 [Blastocatellia bacterium]
MCTFPSGNYELGENFSLGEFLIEYLVSSAREIYQKSSGKSIIFLPGNCVSGIAELDTGI